MLAQRTTNNRPAERLSQYFRDRRAGALKAFLRSKRVGDRPVRVLDLGGRFEFWRRFGLDFLIENRIEIDILNLTQAEAGPESTGTAHGIRFLIGNACDTGKSDGEYDVVFSNSVIEHLVTWDNMIAFSQEVRRVGASYYCQTPNFWFFVDPHYYKVPFFHWLPRPTRAWLLRTFSIATAGKAPSVLKSYKLVDDARLLCRTQMQALFPDATIEAERVGGIFVKSLIAVRSPQEVRAW